MTIKASSAHQRLRSHHQDQIACFAGKNHHISARHLIHKIHMPINPHTAYNQQIARCFNNIKAQGHPNPILIAAIPFDTTQNGTLNFYSDFDKTAPAIPHNHPSHIPTTLVHKKALVERQAFEHSVQLALNAMASDKIQKIVLSQATEYEFNQQHNPEHIFKTLVKQNPDAYNFLIPIEENQYIFGASPELLLSRQQQQVRSNPLAGSRPRSSSATQNSHSKTELYQSAKDRHEHQFVIDNIRHKLSSYCSQFSASETPEILTTSTMLHLSSVFQGQLKDNAPDALNLALHLHPTPAVCGTPTTTARQFILNHEGYNRHYYSGLNGWMDANGNGEWVVTIRNGLLNHNTIRLYAGAGIVAGSDAATEWLETEAKMQTMLNVFQQQ
ncbi:isochorismate synthase MenF [Snodgrassella sp. ESL0253]|uniref:isochorismate synthase n=1 Tax=Snodgrassella sp. ESL0253 TaxID=2705031 RepID=UPI001583217C|nr:isochorismate synthase [Snodgrassella sp. ESL0253]NUE66336.1 isochorismate synthase [Snodgrassella sp. ESL0253]